MTEKLHYCLLQKNIPLQLSRKKCLPKKKPRSKRTEHSISILEESIKMCSNAIAMYSTTE